MTEGEVRTAVVAAYHAKYPEWQNIQAPSVLRSSNGAFYCMVEATDEDEDDIEEICIVDGKGHIRIFDGTGDLVYNLANMRGALLSYFAPTVVSAIAFLTTLVAVIVLTVVPGLNVNKDGFQALTGVLALATGFYFGNQAGKG